MRFARCCAAGVASQDTHCATVCETIFSLEATCIQHAFCYHNTVPSCSHCGRPLLKQPAERHGSCGDINCCIVYKLVNVRSDRLM